MSRYVALAWPAPSEDGKAQAARLSSQLQDASRWTLALDRPGLEIWTAKSARLPVCELGRSGCVVVGDIFDRQPLSLTGRAVTAGPPHAVAKQLISTRWGAYVALLEDPADMSRWVLREPGGFLEAHTWTVGEVAVVAEELQALPIALRPAHSRLDWAVITELARYQSNATHLAPLSGIAPIVPGELRRAGDVETSPKLAWSPRNWIGNDEPAAAADLRSCVFGAVSSLANPEPSLVVEVSGGLDSAIVTAALIETGHRPRIVEALNYYGARRAGDERPWAAGFCNSYNLPLTMVAQEVGELTLEDLAEFSTSMGPAFGAVDVFYDRDVAGRIRDLGASALLGGKGGDAVFFQMPTAAVVADAFRHDWRTEGGRTLQNTARWLRRSVWSVGLEAVGRRATAASDPERAAMFWGPRAWETAPARRHPWLTDLAGVPPAKRIQIQALVGTQAHWSRSRRGQATRVVHPLLAQPVLEFCLATPAWQLVQGGRDRAFAREAFACLLPPAVAQRRSKGALDALFNQRAAASLEMLRPHLLDGLLVGAGVLDSVALDAAMTPDKLMLKADGAQLIRLALLESWVRHWQTRAPDADGVRGRSGSGS
ncbi:asparagine synthase-related protein [Phenylobacterium sp.]|uniref:asparagine synthase-related protein n=1 Tax=Phenylobacterium sp. TaxID=1871053 RepID=UPI00356608DF